jgi:chemotaxis protein methyltransferase CheR
LDLLLSAAEEGEPIARRQLLCLLTTKFTGFFRHPNHFDIAAEHAHRTALHLGKTRLWSAGAATGEEPYSLAMALIEAFRRDDPPATILATDLDADALAVAQRGEYGETTLQALELARRKRFLSETNVARRWSIAPAVRCLVAFRAMNLASVPWLVEGPFHVILCRNVLMYMEASHRCAVLERIASLLAPDGLLMLDPAEHPGKAGLLFTPATAAGVYSLRRASGPRREVPQVTGIPLMRRKL